MFKRVTFLTAAVSLTLLLAGCGGTLGPAPEQTQIRFEAGSLLLRDENVTKTSTPLSDPVVFGVFAYSYTGNWSASRKPNFMFNQSVTFNGSTYSYAPTRFWPAPSNKLSFWAYSPYEASPTLRRANYSTAFTSNTAGLPDILVTVDGHTDYRVTNVVQNQTYSSTNSGYDGTVLMPFNHTLSLIDVKADKDDSSDHYTVKLKSVRFDGLYMTGLLRWSSSPNTWDWASLSGARQNITVWADDPGTNSDDVVLAHSSDLEHSSAVLLTSTPATKLMLLPQSLSDDACRLHVEFTLSYTTHDDVNDVDVQHSVDTSRDVYLRDVFSGLADVTWVENAHYALTITISPNKPILFTVSWSSWGDAHNYFISG